ncbi:YicC/YloC family endoribonuclease [Marinoscillum pacificum]|uniref:YicC/YloC family endoribonuclease n=1 Tax=Marinoscillum pacificum TaxID=392723 RepID=UPI00215733CE|nr:YicC/YloC family endoribonuclease [Marinoscillum pacificum]
MLQSMTGFGSAETESKKYKIKVEVKTLNSKFLDLSAKLPREILERELEIKSMVTNVLKRGKVNLVVEITPLGLEEPNIHINKELFKSYYRQYEALATEVNANAKDLFRLALHSPDVIVADDSSAFEDWELVQQALSEALDKCNTFRASEGETLQSNLLSYIEAIANGLEEVSQRDPERIKMIRERISNNIEDIKEKTQVDQNRFEQELIYYIEKLDITEEKVRLGRHLEYFKEVMNADESQGKKLGFISQEIGREINTIGAKANDAVIQRAVVSMKDELEKIKEQSMNII